MFTVIVEFIGFGRKCIFGLNKIQSEKVYNNWIKNPDVKYVSIIDERN